MVSFPGEERGPFYERHAAASEQTALGSCGLPRVSDEATDEEKRELFWRIAAHLNVLASEVKRAIEVGKSEAG
jgi:hypothetical protein